MRALWPVRGRLVEGIDPDFEPEVFAVRLRALTVIRIVAVLAAVVVLLPDGTLEDVTGARGTVTIANTAYLVASFVLLLMLRVVDEAPRWLLHGSFLVDAAWVSTIISATGGATSAFVFLLHLLLVAALVLFPWHGLTLAVADAVGLALLGFRGEPGVTAADLDAEGLVLAVAGNGPAFQFAALLVVTVAATYFGHVNGIELRRSNRELALLRDLNRDLESSLELEDVSAAVVRGVVDELNYRRAALWITDGDRRMSLRAVRGFADEDAVLGEERVLDVKGRVADAVRARSPQTVARDEERPASLREVFGEWSPLVLVPLASEHRLLGVLAVEVPSPPGRSPRVRRRDIRFLATMATEAALALDNARLHAHLRDLSITDELTGAFNHRYFQQRLSEELDRAWRQSQDERDEEPVSLVLMDIDHFKRVNDTFGHQSGDVVLRHLATLADRVLRSSDVTCRYGGEEFAIILPGTSLGQATHVADRLREAIERSQFTGADGEDLGTITASFGVATTPDGSADPTTLLRTADEALYGAKARGRNRVASGGFVRRVRHAPADGLDRSRGEGATEERSPDVPSGHGTI